MHFLREDFFERLVNLGCAEAGTLGNRMNIKILVFLTELVEAIAGSNVCYITVLASMDFYLPMSFSIVSGNES